MACPPLRGLRGVRLHRRKQRGVALLFVLGALAVLAMMITEFQSDVSSDLASALSKRDALRAEFAAKSGVNLTRLLIAAEPSIREALAPVMAMLRQPAPQLPVWNFAEQILGAFNDDAGRQRFSSFAGVQFLDLEDHKLGLLGARLEIQVVDEESKLNINTPAGGGLFQQEWLAMQLLSLFRGEQHDALFSARDADGNFSDRQAICGEIIDFVDPDQNANPCDPASATAVQGGPELDYYQQLKRRYYRKNAAFDSLEELRMVRGVGEAFWSRFVDPDPDNPARRVMTVWSDERVNVNSANPQVILALICANAEEGQPICNDPIQAASFLSLVSMVRLVGGGAPLFASPADFRRTLEGRNNSSVFAMLKESFNLPTVTFRGEIDKVVTTQSKVFSIYATGVVPSGRRETRRRLEVVVDFRQAPAVDRGTLVALEPGAAAEREAVPLPEGATGDALVNLFRPNPAGTVLYYRMD